MCADMLVGVLLVKMINFELLQISVKFLQLTLNIQY